MQLRPHQQRAFDAMQSNNAGQIIVPTGGGKTYIMIADAINQLKSGAKTIVVVAPRILLANQLCEEFMEFVSATWTHVCMLTVVKLTTSALPNPTRLPCSIILHGQQVSPALSLPPIILCPAL